MSANMPQSILGNILFHQGKISWHLGNTLKSTKLNTLKLVSVCLGPLFPLKTAMEPWSNIFTVIDSLVPISSGSYSPRQPLSASSNGYLAYNPWNYQPPKHGTISLCCMELSTNATWNNRSLLHGTINPRYVELSTLATWTYQPLLHGTINSRYLKYLLHETINPCIMEQSTPATFNYQPKLNGINPHYQPQINVARNHS